jgi:hypothetical protein
VLLEKREDIYMTDRSALCLSSGLYSPHIPIRFECLLVRQILAFENWHKFSWQFVCIEEWREVVFIRYGDGFVMHGRLLLLMINVWHRLVLVIVVARLHLWLIRHEAFISLRTCFVYETGLDGWSGDGGF